LRVCLFTDAEVFAGTERHIFDLAVGLREQGTEVTIAAPQPSVLQTRAREAGLPFAPIQKQGLVDRAAIRALTRMLHSGETDIIHAHNGRTALSAAIALRLAGRGHGVATQHFLEPSHVTLHGPKRIAISMAHRWVNRSLDHFIAISRAVHGRMLTRGEVARQKITIVPNGIAAPDTSTMPPPTTVRAQLKIAREAPLVVCAARLEKEKGIGSLIDAMAIVVVAYPEARCVVAGEGSQKDLLLARIRERGLQGVVTLLGFRTDVPAIIQAGDLFVLPSLAEPFGLVILEAMALRKPVIATRAGGPCEILIDEQTGLLTTPGNPANLAQAILALVADTGKRARLATAGHEHYCCSFTARKMSSATTAVYGRVLASKPEEI